VLGRGAADGGRSDGDIRRAPKPFADHAVSVFLFYLLVDAESRPPVRLCWKVAATPIRVAFSLRVGNSE
jgi:hypothetical protein